MSDEYRIIDAGHYWGFKVQKRGILFGWNDIRIEHPRGYIGDTCPLCAKTVEKCRELLELYLEEKRKKEERYNAYSARAAERDKTKGAIYPAFKPQL